MAATEVKPTVSNARVQNGDTLLTSLKPGLAMLDANGNQRESVGQDRWQSLIDKSLIEWGRLPIATDDEYEQPSAQIVQKAIALANQFRDQGLPAPSSLFRDANGGIVFEYCENDVTEVCHLWDDGTADYQRFEGTTLVERQPLW